VLLHRVRLRDVPWSPLLVALALTATGVAFVASACQGDATAWILPNEARLQLGWWLIAVVAAMIALHVPLPTWRTLALPAYVWCLLVQIAMIAAAGTALVPTIKGQHNWLRLGGFTVQPSEFLKLGVLLCCARLCALPDFKVGRFSHVLGALAVAGIPAVLLAREDLGSALTFPAMIGGMLVVAGMRGRHLAALVAALVLIVGIGVSTLPKEGPKAYQYQRIQAWLHPEDYALNEAYQTRHSIRAIGSGQVTGKGFAAGDQNRLGWLPEKHTDLIVAVIGEETGFVGTSLVVLGFLAFGWAALWATAQCRDPFGRLLGAGFACLVVGQAAINLAVALGLMPVAGITLPFLSYGGSSLLGTWIGVGLVLAAGAARGSGESSRARISEVTRT